MLDPSFDDDGGMGILTKEGGDANIREGASDKAREPRGEPNMLENAMYPRMVYGVKGLGRVEEKKEPIYLILNTFKKKSVDVDDVINPALPRKKTLLGGVRQFDNGRHDGPGHRGGKDAVVGVGDTKRACVSDKTSELFGEKEKEALIEAGGGRLTFAEGLKDT